MLIYNIKKEFVGITEELLRRVGYNTASELQEDAVDFADLFENRPGFIHNFKNFSWLDFILHSEQDNTKARIRCNGKIYECGFKISNYFFIAAGENEPGFIVELTDLNIIGDDDGSSIREVYEPEAPQALQMPDLMEVTTADDSFRQEPQAEHVMPSAEIEAISMPELTEIEPMPELDEAIESFDMDLISEPEPEPIKIETPTTPEPIVQTAPAVTPTAVTSAFIESLGLETPADYVYDPSIAADELGLPSDLIDEFVGDFIVQAKKFRPDLEDAINSQDFDNIQILSHKLKGVAANLRIEDALEILSFINSSKDVSKLNDYLNYLYQIVHRLEFGNDATAPVAEVTDAPSLIESDTAEDDLYAFDLISTDHNDSEASIPDIDESLNSPLDKLEDDMLDISDDLLDLPLKQEEESTTTPLDHIDTNKFDIHEAASNLDIPMETLKSYVDDFVDQANELKSELESALTSNNLEEVKQLATQLKGMSDSLNMTHASELLSVLQTTDDTQVAIENAKELFIFIREL